MPAADAVGWASDGERKSLTNGRLKTYLPQGFFHFFQEQRSMGFGLRILGRQIVGFVALAAMFGQAAPAGPIDYTIVMDNVSGFLDTAAFAGQQVTITMTADTTTIATFGPPLNPFGYSNSVTPGGSTPITVQLGSGPLFNITTPMSVSAPNQFQNNALQFFLGNSISAPRGFTYTWDSSYPGPQAVLTTPQGSTNSGLQVEAAFLSNPLSLSSGGTFYVDATAAGQPGSFNSVLVPEPGSVAGISIAMLAACGLFRRKLRAR